MVLEKVRTKVPGRVYALDADKMKFRYTTKERAGGNGFGLSEEEVMYTLNTIDQHMVGIIYGKSKRAARGKHTGVREGG